MALKIGAEGKFGAPIADDGGEFAHHEAAGLRRPGLGVGVVHPVISDLNGGHRDDLAEIRGIGEYLLISGHRRIEDALPRDHCVGAKGEAPKNAAVFKGENCWLGEGH